MPRLFDLLALLGALLLAVGLWLCHPACAFLGVGASLIVLAFWAARAHEVQAAARREQRAARRSGLRLHTVGADDDDVSAA